MTSRAEHTMTQRVRCLTAETANRRQDGSVDKRARPRLAGQLSRIHAAALSCGIGLLSLLFVPAMASADSNDTGKRSCLLFDELYFHNLPDNLPLTPIHTAYMWDMWGRGPKVNDTPPLDFINTRYKREILNNSVPKTIAINIEHWKSYRVSPEVLQETNRKHLVVLRAFRDLFPNAVIGYYNKGFHPTHGGLDRQQPTEQTLEAWRRTNDGVQPLIDEVDAVFPSLYTNTAAITLEGWERKARVYIEEARRIADGKPIYPYISPFIILDYPNQVDPEIWRGQLEFLSRHSDGMVIWTSRGRSKQTDWDEDAAWWRETLDFLSSCEAQ